MNAKSFFFSCVVILLLAAAACAPGQDPGAAESKTTPAAGAEPTPYDGEGMAPEAAQKAVELLAKELNLETGQIIIQSINEVQWRDACLELAAAEEMCAAVITPGYRVVLEAGGKTYEFHTDRSGDVLRKAPEAALEDIGNLAVQQLAELAGLPAENIQVLGYEQVEWPDGCLGVGRLDEACLAVVVPGYRFELQADGRAYILHTDQRVSQARLAGPEETLAIVKVRQQASADRKVDLIDVKLVSSERVQWRDSCLGIQREGQMCLMVITPGYRIIVKAGDTQMEYHTNASATGVAFYKP